jgi:hypothetical protein
MRRAWEWVEHIRTDRAGTPASYVFALVLGTVLSTLATFATRSEGSRIPWLPIVFIFMGALSGPLRATWARRREAGHPPSTDS